MKFCKENLLLYAVTDRTWENNNFLTQIEQAIKGGITCLQLREKSMNTKDFINEAFLVKKLCVQYDIPLIINDNLEVANAVEADGIHVGQDDIGVFEIKQKYKDKFFVGVSVHNLQEAYDAKEQGADYLGLGAAFSTNTKTDVDTMDSNTMRDICRQSNLPCVAIGGIKLNNIEKLENVGLNGVAVVSAIFAEDNIEQSTNKLLIKAKELFC